MIYGFLPDISLYISLGGESFLKEKHRLTTYMRGLWAELYGIVFLFLKGYRILRWRYKTPVGEVDIIATRQGVISFFEVKLRASLEDGVAAVTPRMQARIARAAEHFMASNPSFSAYSQQFSVLGVTGWRIRHLDNAWVTHT